MWLDQSAAHQREVVIIRSNAFEGPEQFCIDLGLQLAPFINRGFNAFDIPGVKILVTAKPEKFAVTLRYLGVVRQRQAVATAYQAGAAAVFETAIAITDHEYLKLIAGHRCRLAEEPDMVFADALEIGS